jgi:hypothetical protein
VPLSESQYVGAASVNICQRTLQLPSPTVACSGSGGNLTFSVTPFPLIALACLISMQQPCVWMYEEISISKAINFY